MKPLNGSLFLKLNNFILKFAAYSSDRFPFRDLYRPEIAEILRGLFCEFLRPDLGLYALFSIELLVQFSLDTLNCLKDLLRALFLLLGSNVGLSYSSSLCLSSLYLPSLGLSSLGLSSFGLSSLGGDLMP